MADEYGFEDCFQTAIQCDCFFTQKMQHLCGVEAQVLRINNALIYLNDPVFMPWKISADMLEPVEQISVMQPDTQSFNSILYKKTPD